MVVRGGLLSGIQDPDASLCRGVVAENYHPLEIPREYIECYESARMFKVGEAQFAGIRKMPVK